MASVTFYRMTVHQMTNSIDLQMTYNH